MRTHLQNPIHVPAGNQSTGLGLLCVLLRVLLQGREFVRAEVALLSGAEYIQD